MITKERGKQVIKELVSPLLDLTGVYDGRVDALLNASNRLLILMYHRVIQDTASDPFSLGMCVRQKFFAEQIAWLAANTHVLPLKRAVEHLVNGEPLPPRSVVITFDDGYEDNLNVAAPILEQHELPATFYVVTGGLEDNQPLWWDRAISILAGTQATHVDPRELGLGRQLSQVLSLAPGARRASCIRILDALWKHDVDGIECILSAMQRQLQPRPRPELLASRMSVQQVQALVAKGFEIGCHTENHIDPSLLPREQLEQELIACRARLQDICQQPVDAFAYPGGRSSVWLRDLLDAQGFHSAVDTRRGINQAPSARFELARVGMPDTPVGDFKRAIRNLDIISSAP